MNVCFFRHGIAAPRGSPGYEDDERPLTPEGRKKTLQAARGVKALDLGIDTIYSSPLPRALQTAEILSEVLELSRPRVTDRLRPDKSARELLELLSEAEAETPALVGHEPNLSAAVSLLISGSESVSLDFKKAGLAVAEVGKLAPRPSGTLLLLLTPSVLRSLRA